MSDSIQQWILKDLKQYAEDNGANMGRKLMKVQRGRKCQLVKFIAPATENASAVVWGYVSDKECWIPVKFEPEAITRYEITHMGQHKFRSQLGAVCTLREMKLLFTKIPLDGKVGLSEWDHLVLQAGDVHVNGMKGEPAFHMDAVDKKGISRRKEFIAPDQDATVGKWINGLRTGNGHVIQTERVEKKGRAELGAAQRKAQTVVTAPIQPPAQADSHVTAYSQITTPPDSRPSTPVKNTKDEPVNDWSIPEDQMELFVRYNGHGPPSPESDVFSDETEEEGEDERLSMSGINDVDPQGSPATSPYTGWSSSPQRPSLENHEENFKEVSDEEEVEEGRERDKPDSDAALERDISWAQPQRPRSPLTYSFLSSTEPKEERVTQALPKDAAPSSSWATQPRADLSLSWPSVAPKGNEEVEPEPESQEKVSQVSSITTIAPNSSNEVSCSAAFPPAQRSVANLDDLSQSDHSTDSERANSEEPVVEGEESQFSELGYDAAAEKHFEGLEKGEAKSKDRLASTHNRTEGTSGLPANTELDFPRSFKRSSPPPRRLSFGEVEYDGPSIFKSTKRETVSPKLESEDARLGKGLTVVVTRPRNDLASLKRRRSDIESMREGSSKRLKTIQSPHRETLAGAPSRTSYARTPRSSTPLLGSSSIMWPPTTSEPRRLSLMGNGKPLTLWRSLQKNPPPEPSRSRSSLVDILEAHPPLLDLTKMAAAGKRSTKYKRRRDS